MVVALAFKGFKDCRPAASGVRSSESLDGAPYAVWQRDFRRD